MHRTGIVLIRLLALLLIFVCADASSVFTKASNDSLLWGPYRSNLYFGLRPRIPNSLTTGLLWSRVEDYASIAETSRFTCEQHSGIEGYGWDVYDPRTGGVQTIQDKQNGLDLTTTFVKLDGGAWGARVVGTVRDDAEPGFGSAAMVAENLKSTVAFAVSSPAGTSMEIQDADSGSARGFAGAVSLRGNVQGLGDFTLTIAESEDASHPQHDHDAAAAKPLDHTFVHSLDLPDETAWQGKGIIFNSMRTTVDAYIAEYGEQHMPPPWQVYTIQNQPGTGNVHLVQRTHEGSFQFDILYAPSTASTKVTSAALTKRIAQVVKNFDDKYKTVLAPDAPFDKGDDYLEFSKSLFSNLIGGIGYSHGGHVVDRSYAPEYEELEENFHLHTADARSRNRQTLEGPLQLFSAVPSRANFPRGFLWDEGFHLLPIVDWDPDLAMQIVSSWFNIMDDRGWIAREVILGPEARSKVPPEFQTQYPHYANPPTLFMVLEALIERSVEHPDGFELLKPWLRELYPRLQLNYQWYRDTQFSDLRTYDHGTPFSLKEGYRWRGRTPQHILTSGLDDYPRAQPPHPGELHVDLMSWMGLMTRALGRVAKYLDETEDVATYAKTLTAIRRNIDDLHWDEKSKAYCDATINEDFEESEHVCHKGYVSLFPFMTGLMGPEHEHLGDVLNLISNQAELWSKFGIRSLSIRDTFYGTEENYWRSPIWMNMNYLILDNLLDIAQQPGPQQSKANDIYRKLRKNLVDTVYNSWKETGFAWEQYSPETGQGQRTQHFTGWTSLVVKMMAMPESAEAGSKKSHTRDEL